MKGFDSKNIEVESNFDSEGIDMSIAAEDMHFVFDIMFNQMYRDPIGSIIREITSNCFDSHAEAGVTDAVIIEMDDDDGGDYILFKDRGVGISPERMDKIYSKPAKSSKRDSNDQIGYWGLGSKSPLAYHDSFLLTTVYDKVKYEYVIHKGEKGPRIDPIDKYPTEEGNGSEVKIYIKTSFDRYKFEDKLLEQLRYFDNVYVKGVWRFNNVYSIYEGETFKFRNDSSLGSPLHICIGKVYYPIDWDRLGMVPISLPFGLKFNIGDLPITPERESIRYVKIERDGEEIDVVNIIKDKIEACLEEVRTMANSLPREHNNLKDYYANKDKVAYITLLGRNISTEGILDKKSHTYTPLAELNIDLPQNPFFSYTITSQIKTKKVDLKYPTRLTWRALQELFIVRLFKPPGKIPQMKLDYIKALAAKDGKRVVQFIEREHIRPREIKDLLDLSVQVKCFDNKTRTYYFEHANYENGENFINKWKRYKLAIEREVILNSIALEDVEVPEAWAKQWKKERTKKRVTLDYDPNTEIKVKNMRISLKASRERVMLLDDLTDCEGFVLYGFADDEETLEFWADLFVTGKFKDTANVILIKARDHHHFINIPHAVYVHHFMSNNPIFREIANAIIVDDSPVWKRGLFQINRIVQPIADTETINLLEHVFTPLGKAIKELRDIKVNTINLSSSTSVEKKAKEDQFRQEIKELAEENDWVDKEVITKLRRVENYFSDLGLLEYVYAHETAVPYLADYCHLKGRKVNPTWIAPEQWEIELLKELQEKFYYNTSLKAQLLYKEARYRSPKFKTLEAWEDKAKENISTIISTSQYYERKKANQINAGRTEHHS